MMSIKHFFILVLSSFNILFACFYDDPNMIVHLKDTIVDCYSIKIVYNYPMEKCGGLLTGLGLEQKKDAFLSKKMNQIQSYMIQLRNTCQIVKKNRFSI